MKEFAKYIVYISLAAAASCSKSETDEPHKPTQPVEVTFTTEVRTRVQREEVVTGFETGDVMTLFRTSGSGGQATVCRIACTEGVWRGTPAVMLDPEQTAAFQAVYPDDASAADPAACPVSVAAQTDYLYSGPAVAVQPQAPRALLSMRHAQAVMAFNIRSYAGGELEAVTVDDGSFPLAGTMDLTNGKITVTKRGKYAFDCPRSLTEEGWATGHPGCFVFPRSVTAGTCVAVFRIDGVERRVPIPAMTFDAGYKYILQLSLTAQGMLLHPERTEVVALDADGGSAGDPYGCLRVTHRKECFAVPQFAGSALYGMIYWDGAIWEPYAADAAYTYPTAGAHTVVFDMWRADGVVFSDLEGVERIDLSEF